MNSRGGLTVGCVRDEPTILGLTGREAADILGVSSEVYVHNLVAQGRIPKARKHARRGLDRADVELLSLERLKRGQAHP